MARSALAFKGQGNKVGAKHGALPKNLAVTQG